MENTLKKTAMKNYRSIFLYLGSRKSGFKTSIRQLGNVSVVVIYQNNVNIECDSISKRL